MDDLCSSVLGSIKLLDRVPSWTEGLQADRTVPSPALERFIREHRADAEWLVRTAASMQCFNLLVAIDEQRDLGGPGTSLTIHVGSKLVQDESLHDRFMDELNKREVEGGLL